MSDEKLAETTSGGGGNGADVLVVEDEPNDVLLLRRAFRLASLPPPHVVGDGEAAVAFLARTGEHDPAASDERRPPVFVLLDLRMPRMDGFEVLRWLRDAERPPALRRLPVVVLTSSGQNKDVTRAYDLGANSYLTKPVQFQELLEIIKTVRHYWADMNVPPPDGDR